MSPFRAFLSSAIAVALSLVPAAQQQPTFRTEANYIRVDVYATANGAPVTDLSAEDFDLFEDDARQAIDAFQYVRVPGHVNVATLREPNSVAESRSQLETTRGRVFVLFLDARHVSEGASRQVAEPLVNAIDSLIGEQDLIGVMTPDMSPAQMAFGRKTGSIRAMLERVRWGERDAAQSSDPVEDMYRFCYTKRDVGLQDPMPRTTQLMIARRREKITLDALANLIEFLGAAREDRKAVIAVTEGWLLFEPDLGLIGPNVPARLGSPGADGLIPGLPEPGVDPRTGTLSGTGPTNDAAVHQVCEKDRIQLASMDSRAALRDIIGEANRANTSFYTVDPRGLATFDMPVGPDRPVPPGLDRQNLSDRVDSLRTLAEGTDGTAIVQTNDIGGALKRVADDLSSYYLIGYYSNRPLDGRFHNIRVRVTRPGVQVRARRGYQALTTADLARLTSASKPDSVVPDPAAAAATASVGSLAALSRPRRLYVSTAAATSAGRTVIGVVGELHPDEPWRAGADVDIQVTGLPTAVTGRTEVAPGTRAFRTVLIVAGDLPPAAAVGVRVRPRAPDAEPIAETATLDVGVAAGVAGGLYFRRGQTTGNRLLPTADLRFRRGDRLQVEVPLFVPGTVAARLLDRAGKLLAVPVAASHREDADGTSWHTADLALTPLAPGDYVIELAANDATGQERRVMLPFRVVP